MTSGSTTGRRRGDGSARAPGRGRTVARLTALLAFGALALLRTAMSARDTGGTSASPPPPPAASRAEGRAPERRAGPGPDSATGARTQPGAAPGAQVEPGGAGGVGTRTDAPADASRGPGFRSRDRLTEHYRKHGREFGNVSVDEYLRQAQELRDRPPGGAVLEAVRRDGVVTRYDRTTGSFLAANPDGTIRTFFRPNDGEAYFHRQAAREDDR